MVMVVSTSCSLPGRQHLAGIGVDDLGDEVVLRQVHALLENALAGHPGAYYLAQSVVLGRNDVQLFLYLPAHGFGMALAAEQPHAEPEFVHMPMRPATSARYSA